MNRRERRASIRENAKSQRKKRKLNWDKVKSLIRFMLLLWVSLSLFTFVVILLKVVNRNTIRDTVLKNAVETEAVIVRKKRAVGSLGYLEVFKFYVSGEEYFGTTFKNYHGHTGQKICVKYLSGDPDYNLCCNDLVYESIREDVVFSSLKACLWIIVGTTIFNYKRFLSVFS
ncbi:hypothetical protein [Arcicella rigui]|uniref:DUF3592 domain-containing protein n=1 Tax=Arcicella rigui TaxID=797020 RepID=A0ABU5Q6K1_9BACT|nr:hypothetical protein [Arcicella rigui]MEA5138223.1 hypothetical protein [Arcicella rigui]